MRTFATLLLALTGCIEVPRFDEPLDINWNFGNFGGWGGSSGSSSTSPIWAYDDGDHLLLTVCMAVGSFGCRDRGEATEPLHATVDGDDVVLAGHANVARLPEEVGPRLPYRAQVPSPVDPRIVVGDRAFDLLPPFTVSKPVRTSSTGRNAVFSIEHEVLGDADVMQILVTTCSDRREVGSATHESTTGIAIVALGATDPSCTYEVRITQRVVVRSEQGGSIAHVMRIERVTLEP